MYHNHSAKLGLTLLASLVLAACGSSGGNNGDNSAPQVNPSKPTSEQPTQPTPEQPVQPTPEQPVQPTSEQPTQPTPEQPVQPTPEQPTQATSEQPAQPTPEQPQVVKPEVVPPAIEPQAGEKDDQNTNPTQPSEPEQSDNSVFVEEYAGFLIPRKGGNIEELSLTSFVDKFNLVDVEGKDIELLPAGFSGNVVSINDAIKFRYSGGYQYTRWGFIADRDLLNQYLLAYGINPTNNMPTSGSASYEGNGAHIYSKDKGDAIDTFVPTKVKLIANFSDKTLSGNVTTDSNKVIDISAEIKGNKFYGNGENSGGTETSGKFYGNNASELAGNYFNNKEVYIGVFGAKKQ